MAKKKKKKKGGGLAKYRTTIKKATASTQRQIRAAEMKLNKLRRIKAAKTKKAAAAYRRKHK